jgi:MarR family transcriptional regulator, 2-MHQ and catechol-resistance regulon repressor
MSTSPPDASFDDPRLTTVGLLFETAQGLADAFGHALAKAGLSLSEFEVLLRLARSPERRLRMSDLAAQTTLSTSGITRVVDRLERDQLVQRVICPQDRRGYHATLTGTGAEKLAELLPEHFGLIDELVMSRLADSDVDRLTDALRKVRDAVRPTAVQGAVGQ